MAGDWIKMRGNLWNDPRVAKICDLTDQGEAAVVGALYWLWSMANDHTVDGHLPGLTVRQVDRKTGVPGFADAMLAVGWLLQDEGGLSIPRFEDHNGSTTKKRCLTAVRVANHAAKNSANTNAPVSEKAPKSTEPVTQPEPETNADALAERYLEREREREEEGCKHPPAQAPAEAVALAAPAGEPPGGGFPVCPAEQLVALYHEVLPELPGCRVMVDARVKALRRRWRWVLTSRRADGQRRACDRGAAMAWFRAFFERVRHSDWLMGRVARGAGHEGWQCDLDFLLSDKGLKAVVEKTEVRT